MKAIYLFLTLTILGYITITNQVASEPLEGLPQDIKELFISLRANGHLDNNYLPITKEGYHKLMEANLIKDNLNIEAQLIQNKASDLLYQVGTSESEDKLIEVIQELETAITIDPNYGLAYRNLSWAYLFLSRLSVENRQHYRSKAFSMIEKAANIDSGIEDDVDVIKKAIESDKSDEQWRILEETIEAKIQKSSEYIEAGIKSEKYQEKIRYFYKAIEIDPKNFGAYSFLAHTYYNNYDYKRAIEAWQKALELNPELIEARFRLIDAYIKLSEVSKAKKECEKILKLDPQNNKARDILSNLNQ